MNWKKISKRKLFLLFGDIFIILFSINLALSIRLKKSAISYLGLNETLVVILIILTGCIISFYIFDLYNIKEKFTPTRTLIDTLGSVIFITLISIGLFYLFPYILGRGVFFITLFSTGILVAIWRLSYSFLFKLTFTERNILILGIGASAETIYSSLKKNPEYKIVGFIADTTNINEFSDAKVLGNSSALEKIVEDYKIDDIIVAVESSRKIELNKTLVNCKMKGISIYDMATFYEHLLGKLPISFIEEKWLLYSNGFDKLASKINKRTKRIIDFSISLVLLIIFFPVGTTISLLIKILSKGPIFLVQERVGENYKPFNLIKFRTMIIYAESAQPRWAENNDPRVTRIGKILRKMRLDELPQLINVVKGEMSLIGPRPEREFFVKKLVEKIPFYTLRFCVKPGLTGWAQVNYPYGASEEDALEKLQYDLYYIKNMSLFLDLRIFLKTIRIVLFGMGR